MNRVYIGAILILLLSNAWLMFENKSLEQDIKDLKTSIEFFKEQQKQKEFEQKYKILKEELKDEKNSISNSNGTYTIGL